MNAYFGDAVAQTTYLDLYKGLYQIGHFDWKKGKVNYDQNYCLLYTSNRKMRFHFVRIQLKV